MKYVLAMMLFSMAMFAQQTKVKPAEADPMADCPMHSQHAKATNVDRRGDEGMGFSHEKTQHHFLIAANGGSIEAQANESDDKASVDAIRMHMRHIAMMFAQGDFSIPMFVHEQTPPGVDVMRANKKDISYKYEELPLGARVVIETSDGAALKAVQEFLKFQIAEHRTGDATASHH